jgi:hypothetical protein
MFIHQCAVARLGAADLHGWRIPGAHPTTACYQGLQSARRPRALHRGGAEPVRGLDEFDKAVTAMHQHTLASINFSQGLSNAWSNVAQIVPKFIGFLAILVIGWFISRLLTRVLDRVLRRVGFEKVAERGGISRALAQSKYDTTALVCKVVYYALLLVTLQMALGVFGTNPVSTMINGVVSWLPKGLVACVIVIVAAAIARVVKDLVGSALSSLSYGRTLAVVASVFVLALGVIAALGQAGIATTITGPVLVAVLATIAGILIVGVGGGMVMPMRERWERMLNSAEREVANASSSITAYQAGRSDAYSGQGSMRPAASASAAAAGTAERQSGERLYPNPPASGGGSAMGDFGTQSPDR